MNVTNQYKVVGTIRLGLLLTIIILTFFYPSTALDLNINDQQSISSSIARGDSVHIHGVATGHPQIGLQIWFIGNNYVKVTTISVASDSSFDYELKPVDTQNLAPGQYFVLIQHPMMNGQFDIVYNAATGQVINKQLGVGSVIFTLTGPGSLQGPNAATALINAVHNQNIDDTFTTVSFFVEEPNALINPIGNHNVGEKFTITGSTNLAVDDDLLIEIYSLSFRPTTKEQSNEFSGTSGIVKVQPGTNGNNQWSYGVDTSAFKPDEYIVQVSGINPKVSGSASFNIVDREVSSGIQQTVTQTSIETFQPSPTTKSIPTTYSAPDMTWILILGFAIGFTLFNRHHIGKL
jgi:hypothetical protein